MNRSLQSEAPGALTEKRRRGRPAKKPELKVRSRKLIYNGEVAHCAGNNCEACTHCVRRVMYYRWDHFPEDMAESIILLVPRARGDECRNQLTRDRYFKIVDSLRVRKE